MQAEIESGLKIPGKKDFDMFKKIENALRDVIREDIEYWGKYCRHM